MLNRYLTPETRYRRRSARIERWSRPIDGRRGRLAAWLNMLFVDHGVFRLAYANRAQIRPGIWRSAQPTPRQIRWFARQGGRTVVNLRGGREHGSWSLEREACERHGLALVDFVLRSREAPDRDTLLSLETFLDDLAFPILVHCKSGADRAGLFAALILLHREGATVAEARRQLSLRFGHVRLARTGILDAFLDAYEEEGERNGLSLREWTKQRYDPSELATRFRPRFWPTFLIDRIMRRE